MNDELIIRVMNGETFRKQFPDKDPCSIGIIVTPKDILVLPLDSSVPFSCSTKRYRLMQERAHLEGDAQRYEYRQRYGEAARWKDLDADKEAEETITSYKERIDAIDKQLSEPEEPYLGRIMYDWFVDNADCVVIGHASHDDD